MQNQVDIRCRSCGQVTPTTRWAQRFRCSSCRSEVFVQHSSGDQDRTVRSGYRPNEREYSNTNGFQVNQNKCIMVRANKVRDFPSKTCDRPTPANGFVDGGRKHGKKRALICGVSYNNQKYMLRGTRNDAYAMKNFLVGRWGFSTDDIRLLTEEGAGGSTSSSPTKKNMEAGLRWLVEGCNAGDSLVFYFSGHGINQREASYGDEIDSMDESLCPVDFTINGVIRDNDLNAALVRPLPRGVTLHAIVDACHSGTILDLPWVFDTKQNKWVDNRPPSGAEKGAVKGGRVISFSACRDDQMAADTSAFSDHKGGNKTMNGALTMSFIQVLEKNNIDLSYHNLLLQMQETISKSRGCKFRIILDKFLRQYFVQDPLLSSSIEFNVLSEKVRL